MMVMPRGFDVVRQPLAHEVPIVLLLLVADGLDEGVIEDFNDVQEMDIIEAYIMVEVPR